MNQLVTPSHLNKVFYILNFSPSNGVKERSGLASPKSYLDSSFLQRTSKAWINYRSRHGDCLAALLTAFSKGWEIKRVIAKMILGCV